MYPSLEERTRAFDVMGGFQNGVGGMVLSDLDGTAETIPRQWVTAGFFDVLGGTPMLGRAFLPSDDSQQSSVVVLTEALWRARFDADPSVVGRDIRLDGTPYTVVGVMPQEAQLFGRTSIWALLPLSGSPASFRSVYFLQAVG